MESNSSSDSNLAYGLLNLSKYDIIWHSPSKNQDGSMPIGNGETGLNVWVDTRGRLVFLISRTDAWDEIGRLCKLGRIVIDFTPSLCSPFNPFQNFTQRLNLKEGCIEINATKKNNKITLKIWVDSNSQQIHLDINATLPVSIKVTLESWRKNKRETSEKEESFPIESNSPKFIYPDRILQSSDGLNQSQIGIFHQNQDSIWKSTMTHQGLGELIPKYKDPLQNRIFGYIVNCDSLQSKSPTVLGSVQPIKDCHIIIYTHTEESCLEKDWLHNILSKIKPISKDNLETQLIQHQKWWGEFWARSWIFITGSPQAEEVTLGYILQRWIAACGGRGNYPIKFNGSIFTVDTDRHFDPDYRRWGGGYWFQNTRLPYIATMMAGDFDLFQPFIKMYHDAIHLGEERTKIYWKHEGWFLPETMSFWGTYTNINYGLNRNGMKPGDPIENRYIRYHFNNSLEFLAMILEYYFYTEDQKFFNDIVIPTADGVFSWWENHWSRDSKGYLLMSPSNSIETYWDCTNPTPDLAGLRWDLECLLKFPLSMIPINLRKKWENFQKILPDIPINMRNGKQLISPAYEPLPRRTNCENPELYAIFPFPLYGLTKPNLTLAQETFKHRIQYNHVGWSQDELQAALLGLTADAQSMIVKRASSKHKKSRFPAFWGPNFDWVPDQDHGSNLMSALQRMVVQGIGNQIVLLPAWPKEWSVHFKLHLPKNTTIEGIASNGSMEKIDISPIERKKDIISIN